MAKRKMQYGPFRPMRGARGQAEAVQSEDSVASDNSRFESQPRHNAARDEAIRKPAGSLKPQQLRRMRRQARFPEGRATPDML
jgi:hypothetical protein